MKYLKIGKTFKLQKTNATFSAYQELGKFIAAFAKPDSSIMEELPIKDEEKEFNTANFWKDDLPCVNFDELSLEESEEAESAENPERDETASSNSSDDSTGSDPAKWPEGVGCSH